MAKARDRVAVVEHHTIIVASAGCMTAIPAPSSAADSNDGRLRARQPQAQRTDGGGDRTGDQHRQRSAPVDRPTGERQDDQRGHREHRQHQRPPSSHPDPAPAPHRRTDTER